MGVKITAHGTLISPSALRQNKIGRASTKTKNKNIKNARSLLKILLIHR